MNIRACNRGLLANLRPIMTDAFSPCGEGLEVGGGQARRCKETNRL